MGDLLRAGEVAHRCGVSPAQVWRWSRRAVRPLPSVPHGVRELRFRWGDVEAWLASEREVRRCARVERARERLERARVVVEVLEGEDA